VPAPGTTLGPVPRQASGWPRTGRYSPRKGAKRLPEELQKARTSSGPVEIRIHVDSESLDELIRQLKDLAQGSD
jgi:hypothetical protein